MIFKAYELEKRPIPDTIRKADRDLICERLVVLMTEGKILASQMKRKLSELLDKVGN